VLVRHGETEWSKAGKHTGRTDVPLTDRGREEARLVGKWLAGRSFERVLTSPLSRALETCELARPEGPVERRDELLEWDYGEYDGLTTAEIRKSRPDWSLWRDGCPGGEDPVGVAARVDRLLEGLRDLAGDVALFAHGHVLRLLTARWLGLGPEGGTLFWLQTATLSVLGYERETRVMRVWNTRGALTELA
jgi:broad specificity phosphatase PhoE